MTTGRRAGLGRGLGALLPTGEEEGARIVEVGVEEVWPNPRQPRTEFDEAELSELAASIEELGVLQPIVVRPREAGGYELLVGERRLRASRMAGVERVPAIIREADDREALEQALVENVQRADLHALEEAQAFYNLVEVFELTQEDVARRVGKSRAHVANTLRLLDLPDDVKGLVAGGRLTAGHARALLQVKDAVRQLALARRAVEEGLTVRKVESLAREEKAGPATPSAPASQTRRRKHPDLEESLSDHLQTEVRIEEGRGKGKILIAYGSKDDLHRITELLLGY